MYHEYRETQTAQPVHDYAHPRKSPSDLLTKQAFHYIQELKGARPRDPVASGHGTPLA